MVPTAQRVLVPFTSPTPMVSASGTRLARRQLLARSIQESGLTQHDFAIGVLMRDPRTVRRWLSGQRPVPAIVGRCLEGLVAVDGGIRGALHRGVRVTLRSAN